MLSLSHRLAALESVLKSTGVIHAGAVDAQAGVRGQAPVGGHTEDAPKKDQSSVKKTVKAGQATSSAADRAARAGSEIESSTRGGGATDDESIADRNGGVDSETEGAAITLEVSSSLVCAGALGTWVAHQPLFLFCSTSRLVVARTSRPGRLVWLLGRRRPWTLK